MIDKDKPSSLDQEHDLNEMENTFQDATTEDPIANAEAAQDAPLFMHLDQKDTTQDEETSPSHPLCHETVIDAEHFPLEAPKERSWFVQRLLPIGVICLTLITFSMLAFYAYQFHSKDVDVNSLPIIKADTTPFKTLPEDPGGMQFPHQDKEVFTQITSPAKNIVIDTPNKKQDSNIVVTDSKNKKTTQHNDMGTNKVSPLLPAPENPPTIKAQKLVKNNTSKSTKNVTTVSPIKKVYKIQLGSYKSRSDAEKGWSKIRSKFSHDLRGLSPSIIRKSLKNQGVYYRLQAGPFTNEPSARSLCKKLINKQQGCFFVQG